MIRRPPRSTLFPYTRSSDLVPAVVTLPAGQDSAFEGLLDLVRMKFITRDETDPTRRKLDRKSTRLNSSHVEISYAVFCLKKKKDRTATNGTYPPPHRRRRRW